MLDSGAAVATLTAVEDLRIDGNDELFVVFGRIAVAPNGNIVVPQFRDYQFRFYSPEGKRIGTLGRDGAGPGEFRAIESIFGWTGDTLWVWDHQLNRVTYATSDGRYIDDESLSHVFAVPRDWGRLPAVMGVSQVIGIHSGELLVLGRAWKSLPSMKTSRGPIVAVGSMQIMTRFVAEFPRGSDSDYVAVNVGARHLQEIGHPLRAGAFSAVAPDAGRLAYLTTHVDDEHGGRLHLTVLSPTGDTLVARGYGFVGEPRSRRIADSIVASRLESRRAFPRQYEGMRQALARGPAQPVYAPVQTLVLGRDSTTWIGFRSIGDVRTWLVLDAAGEPIGSLGLPATFRLSVAERGTVWGSERDEDRVQSVVRYRVTGW
jgi:hypothetical protein